LIVYLGPLVFPALRLGSHWFTDGTSSSCCFGYVIDE
jgi:hypothetical protein